MVMGLSTSMSPMPVSSSSSSLSKSPSTSLLAASSASIFSASSLSSRSLTARAASFTISLPLAASMLFLHASHATFSTCTGTHGNGVKMSKLCKLPRYGLHP
eukprot:GHRR01031309.1.p1 GENE.GHRR01031309.1~~GHRR01031309.1.p1  ORF type:complete len:102 (-),score=5.72 GHRR01031309.1:245-550(-)